MHGNKISVSHKNATIGVGKDDTIEESFDQLRGIVFAILAKSYQKNHACISKVIAFHTPSRHAQARCQSRDSLSLCWDAWEAKLPRFRQ